MQSRLFAAALLLIMVGCTDMDPSFDSPDQKATVAPTASQVAADHATADPSINTINQEGTHSSNRNRAAWTDTPAGDGNSP